MSLHVLQLSVEPLVNIVWQIRFTPAEENVWLASKLSYSIASFAKSQIRLPALIESTDTDTVKPFTV